MIGISNENRMALYLRFQSLDIYTNLDELIVPIHFFPLIHMAMCWSSSSLFGVHAWNNNSNSRLGYKFIVYCIL